MSKEVVLPSSLRTPIEVHLNIYTFVQQMLCDLSYHSTHCSSGGTPVGKQSPRLWGITVQWIDVSEQVRTLLILGSSK